MPTARALARTLLSSLLVLLAAEAAASGECGPGAWRICDRDGTLSPAEEREIESMLAAHERSTGLHVQLATLPLGGEIEELPGYGAPEAEDGDAREGSLLLVVSGGRLSWRAGEELERRLDPRVMFYLERKNLCPPNSPTVSSDRTVAQGLAQSLPILDSLLAGRTPLAYYRWKLLEAPPDGPVNPGAQAVAVIGLRYLLAVCLMAPQIAILALFARGVLPWLESSRPQRLLFLLGLVVALSVAGWLWASALESTPLAPFRSYVVAASLFFLLATPIHLLLVDRVVSDSGLSLRLLFLSYLLFPVAVLLFAASGGYRDPSDRLLRGFPGGRGRER